MAALKQALDTFHERYGIPNILISSIPSSQISGLEPGQLVCAGSTRQAGTTDSQQFTITFPSLPEHYEGVGDVFSSLVLANFAQPSGTDGALCPLSTTAELAIASLQGILARTREHALLLAQDQGLGDITGANPDETPEERIRRLALVELRLVQSWREIREPKVIHHAQPI